MRLLTAQTLGVGAVMAGSYLARKILDSVPQPAPSPQPPSATDGVEATEHKAPPTSRRAA